MARGLEWKQIIEKRRVFVARVEIHRRPIQIFLLTRLTLQPCVDIGVVVKKILTRSARLIRAVSAVNRNSVMRNAVMLISLLASLFVILSGQYDPNSQHWAFATVGTILGYWLRGGRRKGP